MSDASTRTSGRSRGQLDDHAVAREALGSRSSTDADDLGQRAPVAIGDDRAGFEARHLQDLRDVLGHRAAPAR